MMARSRLWCDRLVYVVCGNRKQRFDGKGHRYRNGGSRILYIGVTALGKRRPSVSMARLAERAFGELRGVKTIRVHLVKCGRRRHVKTWQQLESALIRRFRDKFGFLPRYNETMGVRPKKRRLFSPTRLDAVIEELS